jgi:hypothetical protein
VDEMILMEASSVQMNDVIHNFLERMIEKMRGKRWNGIWMEM